MVMGYHPGIEDDGVYLSAVKYRLEPALYPHDSDFSRLQLQASVFDKWMAGFIRMTHIPVALAELIWQLLSLYVILWAAHSIARRLFPERRAQWAGVALLTAMFTLPVAGTAINLADQHLHPRNMATAIILLAVDRTLGRRLWEAVTLLFLALLMHPIMAAFGFSFCFFLALTLSDSFYRRWSAHFSKQQFSSNSLAATVPLGWIFEPPTPAWRRALETRTYYFLYQWTWYEWLGALAPIALFWFLRRYALRQSADLLSRFALGLVLYAVFQQVVAMILLAPDGLVRVAPLQPMRYLHLVYVFMALIAGCLLGRHVLEASRIDPFHALNNHPSGAKARSLRAFCGTAEAVPFQNRIHATSSRISIWRWAVFLIAINAGMFASQRAQFPNTEHLELPGLQSKNPWLQAFEWIRQNTPRDAYFALGPNYLAAPQEDYHSFRALAERSQLADAIKDAAVVTQVPGLGSKWVAQVDAQTGWSRFRLLDFERLKAQFGVGWALVSYPQPEGLACNWHNDRLAVCQIPD
jgi:hypothetical protein